MAWLTGRRRPKRPKRSLKRRMLDQILRLPSGLLERIGGGQVEVEGRRLDPIYPFLLRFAKKGKAIHDLDPAAARRVLREKVDLVRPEPLLMDKIEDRHIESADGSRSLPIRIYLPPNLAEDPAPAVVYFHGGGWVQGDLESHHALCTLIAQRIPCRVISVDYRRAPEDPFPAAVDDAVAAYRWAVAEAATLRVDPTRIAVAGDSAGGNLAAVTCLQLRDLAREGTLEISPPCLQVLLYPVTDLPRGGGSYEIFANGFSLDRATMRWFFRHYTGEEDGIDDPRVAPLRAEDLSGLPPTIIATAFFDVLRDECRDFAKALEGAGVEIRHFEMDDQVHGFASVTGAVPSARAAVDEICSELAFRFHQLKR